MLHREGGLLEALPRGRQANDRLGHIATDDAEGDQLAQGHLVFEHQRGTHGDHQDAGYLVNQLDDTRTCGAGHGGLEALINCFQVALFPALLCRNFGALHLDCFKPIENLNGERLGSGLGLSLLA